MKVMEKAFQRSVASAEKKQIEKNPYTKTLRSSKRWRKALFPKIKSRINKRNKVYDR